MSYRLLIVEDDQNLRETLADNLELEGFDVLTAGTLAQGKLALERQQIDLMVLDLMLPDGEGFSLCSWAQANHDVLVLMLTARSLEKDVVEGFIAGCDDYVSKPYRAAELMLRIKALLRRKLANEDWPGRVKLAPELSELNGYHVNWSLREVSLDGQQLHITKTAFNILEFLYHNKNQCCTRDDILDTVWGKDIYVDNRTVDNFVSQLKKQLQLSGDKSYQIKTIRGLGYSLVSSL
jgi:DNA-binding response OmpR family regulator